MLQDSIGKDDVLEIVDRIIERMDPASEADRLMMASGLHLYRQGLVYNVYLEDDVLKGTVSSEGTVCSVELPISNVDGSVCTCFQDGYCEHEIAVLFYTAASFGLVGEVMKRFKEKNKPTLPKLKTAKQLLQSSIYEEKDPSSWHTYFQRDFDSFLAEQNRYPFRQSYLLINLFEDLYMKLTRKAPRVAVLRELFELHAALFCFERLLEIAEDFENKHIHSYYKPASIAQRFVEEATMIIHKLASDSIPLAYDEIFTATGQIVHTLFFSYTDYIQERFFLYREIWDELLRRDLWIEEERARIATKPDQLLQTLAYAHLAFLQRQDEVAMQQLDSQSYLLVELYFYWLDEVCAKLEWDRVKHWLSFTYQKLKIYLEKEENVYKKRDLVRFYLSTYSQFAEETNEEPGYEMVIQDLLPYSFYEYDQYLLEKKQYRTWTELQMFMGYETIESLRGTLKEIEKEEQDAVLPLYHHAVMQTVQQKNRQSYRIAVRYLKRLRILYKKLKRQAEWNAYITVLSKTFSRLRAFQEELRKGKLIDDDR
ncbi:SWIM zinc finger domain-containing protein [Ectobacillus sp. sgz5001026]|uniref:SWIM zinc finger family protein n=1 Tax=Ectobacillus sp. sgz5001026 TaxID=3242473 RepID=UPI0036D35689